MSQKYLPPFPFWSGDGDLVMDCLRFFDIQIKVLLMQIL